jgi:hypothetical protein
VAKRFSQADDACEDAFYDITAFREFCGFDLGRERISDTTILLRFRLLLEEYDFGKAMFARVGALSQTNDVKASGDAIVEATRIAAPGQEEHPRPLAHVDSVSAVSGLPGLFQCRQRAAWCCTSVEVQPHAHVVPRRLHLRVLLWAKSKAERPPAVAAVAEGASTISDSTPMPPIALLLPW